MNIFLISDTHFGHSKMLEYEARPFDFEEKILDNLKVIKDEDILVHLGDVCIGRDAYWNEMMFSEIPMSRCILVRGNHDGKSFNWYYDHGWNFVCDSFTMDIYGKKILFSHIPQLDGDYDINIHGHCHSKKRTEEFEPTMHKKQYLVSLENLNYKPIRLDTFLKSNKLI